MKKYLVLGIVAIALSGCGGPKFHRGPIRTIWSEPLPQKPAIDKEGRGSKTSNRSGVHQYRGKNASGDIESSSYHDAFVPGGPALPLPAEELKKQHQKEKEAAERTAKQQVIWRVTGGVERCTLHLTQQPFLDLYKARAEGCNGGPFAKTSTWRRKGDEIEVMAPGEKGIARFKRDGNGYKSIVVDDGSSLRLDP